MTSVPMRVFFGNVPQLCDAQCQGANRQSEQPDGQHINPAMIRVVSHIPPYRR